MQANQAPRIGRYTFLGISDDVDACDCCGRTGLKRTVALHPTSDPTDVRYYGTSCAAAALRTTAGRVTKTAQAAQRAADARAEQRARFAATLATIDAAIAATGHPYTAYAALRDAAAAGDQLAAAAIHTANSLPNVPDRRDDRRHGLVQARAWYAERTA